jgi:hypothetical protein
LFMWLQNCYVGDRKWRLPKTFCTVIWMLAEVCSCWRTVFSRQQCLRGS